MYVMYSLILFLNKYFLVFFVCINISDDTRPGLLSRSQARKNEIEKSSLLKLNLNKTVNQPIKVIEEENREKALAKSIIVDSEEKNNKGLNMMKKMGFKIGESLGKHGGAEGGIKVPIGIKIKTGREGLGAEEMKKRKMSEIEERRKKMSKSREMCDETNKNLFILTRKQLFLLKQTKKNLYKSQKICYQLDSNQVISFS